MPPDHLLLAVQEAAFQGALRKQAAGPWLPEEKQELRRKMRRGLLTGALAGGVAPYYGRLVYRPLEHAGFPPLSRVAPRGVLRGAAIGAPLGLGWAALSAWRRKRRAESEFRQLMERAENPESKALTPAERQRRRTVVLKEMGKGGLFGGAIGATLATTLGLARWLTAPKAMRVDPRSIRRFIASGTVVGAVPGALAFGALSPLEASEERAGLRDLSEFETERSKWLREGKKGKDPLKSRRLATMIAMPIIGGGMGAGYGVLQASRFRRSKGRGALIGAGAGAVLGEVTGLLGLKQEREDVRRLEQRARMTGQVLPWHREKAAGAFRRLVLPGLLTAGAGGAAGTLTSEKEHRIRDTVVGAVLGGAAGAAGGKLWNTRARAPGVRSTGFKTPEGWTAAGEWSARVDRLKNQPMSPEEWAWRRENMRQYLKRREALRLPGARKVSSVPFP